MTAGAVRRLSLPMENQIPRLIAQHAAVLAALEKKDADGAAAIRSWGPDRPAGLN